MNNKTLIVPNNYSAQVHLLELYIYEKLKRLSGQYIEDITPPKTLEEMDLRLADDSIERIDFYLAKNEINA